MRLPAALLQTLCAGALGLACSKQQEVVVQPPAPGAAARPLAPALEALATGAVEGAPVMAEPEGCGPCGQG